MESSMEVSQKTKIWNTVQPSNSTSENLPEENKITTLKRYMHSYVHCSIIYNSQDMEVT